MRVIDLPIEELEFVSDLFVATLFKIVAVVRTSGPTHVVVLESGEPGNADTLTIQIDQNGRDVESKRIAIRPKKRKKTFIKTLKELVDSGWDTEVLREEVYLSHTRSDAQFHRDMLKFCGHERIYHTQTEQSRWTWTPEMLIEKEV